ncbi:PmoA family protein [Microbacterium indicum]|uniref:DUF6807 domain-containing protein n=1 Tax=Microbacterium indicum TaxID=358100 RepID=UPI0004121903|nr:PmoA family protein [Microbacterium indicum]
MTTTQIRDDAVLFLDGDAVLARYEIRPRTAPLESPRPYVHPLRTRAGREVTLFRPDDHVWHQGLSLALPNAGPHNFWGGPTFTREAGRYVQLPNNGAQVHAEERDAGPGAYAHRLAWIAADGSAVFSEERRLRAAVLADDAWALRWETSLRNVSGGTLAMGSPTTQGRENAGYGGLFWRGPRSFEGGRAVTPGGLVDADAQRGGTAPWMGLVGDGATVVMAGLDRDPQWFVRSEEYAGLCPAPFFDEELALADGAILELRCDLVIADGALDPARAAHLVEAARFV